MNLSFQNETQVLKNFSRKNQESQGLMSFKEFVTEDSDAVISQIRQIRDQMRVIKLKRDLEREKDELQTLMQQKIVVLGFDAI